MKPIADYAYAVARLHSIENRMLSADILERLCESGSVDDAYKLLSDHGYTADSQYSSEYDTMLKNEMIKVFVYISNMISNKEYLRIFYMKKDYHNIKVLMKAERLSSDYSSLLEDGGLYPKNALIGYIRDRKYSALSSTVQEAIEDVVKTSVKTSDPQLIDIILDNAYFCDCKKNAEELDNRFLKEFAAMSIDLVNIKSYIRIRKQGLGIDLLSRIMIKGGTKGIGIYINSHDTAPDKILSEFIYTSYKEIMTAGVDSIASDDGIPVFEKAIDNYIINYIKPYRHMFFGIEPVLSHIIAKEYEIKNIRIALSGVINSVRPDTIKERLRIAYV